MMGMLNCELCDYYKKLDCAGKCGTCQFTGVVFAKKPETLEMDYPCAGVSYAAYLSRQQEICCAEEMDGENWKYAYARAHLKTADNRA